MKLAKADPLAALRFKNYRLFAAGELAANIGRQMQSVAIGWELYERLHSAWVLAGVGLVQALPVILLVLPAGHIADRFDRKTIVLVTQTMWAMCALTLTWLSLERGAIGLVYACLFLEGVALAFSSPARSALLPQLVPPEIFGNAVTWNSLGFQTAAVLGPALGGWVIVSQQGAAAVYQFTVLTALIQMGCMAWLKLPAVRPIREPLTIASLGAGISFVWHTKIILAALTLDLFAVLFGGAVTLLPIFARDILQVDATGLGWLRAAPALGAFGMAGVLTLMPLRQRAGQTLLIAVAGFGVATMIFGLSRSFWLSWVMLLLTGVLDNISVVVRSTLLQLATPDSLRGRVLAVNSVFISASNELGGFESGLSAALVGPVLSVVAGGFATLVVVVAVIYLWPQLRQLDNLQSFKPDAA